MPFFNTEPAIVTKGMNFLFTHKRSKALRILPAMIALRRPRYSAPLAPVWAPPLWCGLGLTHLLPPPYFLSTISQHHFLMTEDIWKHLSFDFRKNKCFSVCIFQIWRLVIRRNTTTFIKNCYGRLYINGLDKWESTYYKITSSLE